ncbi:pyocin activator PrtN family protein [Psychromonas ossibalaenae]|uniref:pyocin activator PrtN family protein n=1 Tax=Psychromonas ossibalaenae TaxID=444922 RepID=UPI00036CDA4C|nr:pyocin activator PrtN family protein [Psychromonas ossibalaenae]
MKASTKPATIADIEQELLNRFGSSEIPLKEISKEVLNMMPRVAAEKAAKRTLPFPAHRLRNRLPWMVTLKDVATAIFDARCLAQKEWEAAQPNSPSPQH